MATHSSILTWKIPWMEEPGRLQSMGWKRGLSHFTSLIFSQGALLILMSLSNHFNLASGGFLAAPPLTSSSLESTVWNSGKVMEAEVLTTRSGGQKRLLTWEPPRILLGFLCCGIILPLAGSGNSEFQELGDLEAISAALVKLLGQSLPETACPDQALVWVFLQ